MLTMQAVLTFEGKLNHEKLVAAISPLLDDEKTKVKLTAVELLALLYASLGAGTQFACFTGTKDQSKAHSGRAACAPPRLSRRRYSIYLLYWYKSTNTDALVELLALLHASLGAGT